MPAAGMKRLDIPNWQRGLLLLFAGCLAAGLWLSTQSTIWAPVHGNYLYHTNGLTGQSIALVKLENRTGAGVSYSIRSERLVGGHWQFLPSLPQDLNAPVAGYSGWLEPHSIRLVHLVAPEHGERFCLQYFSDPPEFRLRLQRILLRLNRFGIYRPLNRRITTIYLYPKS